MSISYMLAKMMKGRIFAESKLGEGSRFTVEIPFGKCRIQDIKEEKEYGCIVTDEKKRHVLVAEDNMMNIEILQVILEKNGFEVTKPIMGRIRIFACTANLVSGDEGRIYRYGMNRIITKPIDARALINMLKY